ncbi:glycosyltransferase family 32 protein [Granulosicoccus antarcticus]|uniref:Mannosyltransferase n=1 Tax=Granulosicoccus antarcticus IMCC3135 TaxID=1192854 RepID=A0A2Z2P0T1_9GAMM|nr:glycosyltransferase [Granulosicoccus antarcticus]ASJ75961.1 hypothetical protein IMCC3135_29555 [Granulosicoccus antarcticus IMCC3135]
MIDLTELKSRLKTAASLRGSGQYEQARQILDTLAADPTIKQLGQQTSLGMPRQLQSALLKLAKAEKDAVHKAAYQYHLVPPPELLNKYAQFSSSERRHIAQLAREPIPRNIHQIWIGSMPPPEGSRAWERHASQHDYAYKLWREEDLRAIGVEDNPVYQKLIRIGNLPGAVDIARYMILEKLGGIYLDCDWYPARNDLSFDDLLPMNGLTAMPEDIPRNTGKGGLLLANSMLLAPAGHPVFTRLLKALNDVWNELPEAPVWWTTGPLIFTLMSRGGAVTLADAAFVAGSLPQETPLNEVDHWCQQAQQDDLGLLLLWKSWIW